MRYFLLMIAVVVLVGCGTTSKLGLAPIVEEAVANQFAAGWSKPPPAEWIADYLDMMEELDLSRKQLTRVPKGIEKLTQLKILHLKSNKLTSEKGLEKPEKLTKLWMLWLGGNQLTDVTGLEKLTKLEQLDLGYNQMTEIPKGLEKCSQLEVLVLRRNKLTSVKGLEKLTKLKRLYLYDNPALTKAQIAELKKALPKCKIGSNPTK